ncbi:MAG: hypothetical protein K8F57_05340, partial [Alphaproteobacteria bacterium]|nr:hypothetical protein [Alphaproteobacteria bacterium]
FVSEDGIEICVVRGSGVRTLNLVLEGDVVVDSQGNVHVITTYGRDLRVYSLAAEKIATGQVRPADWTWERIAFMARYPRMTIDENDVFHIAYSDGWNHEVRYATGAPGGPWEIEAVDSMSSFGSRGYDFKNTQGAISLGPDGSPHMAWKNWDELSVRYGHRVAGIWETEIAFDETGVGVDVGYQIALDIAPDDSAHVVSEAGEQSPWAFGGLIYASKPDGGSFTTAWIPVLFSTNPEVVAESVGHAFISYYGTGLLTDFAPRIAEKTGDTWSYYVVGPPSGQISFNSVFFDAENAPTAFFTWGDANDTFRRVRRTGKTWTSEPYYSPADDGQVTKAKYCSNT